MGALLNGKARVALLVNTGAEQLVISRRLAARLGLDVSRPLRWQTLIDVGQTVSVPVVRLDRVRVGSSAAANLAASVYDLLPFFRADGSRGLNFLGRSRATFEFDTRTLVLRPFPTAS